MNVKEINNYYAEAREKWGNTSEYKEYEAKSKNRTKQEFEDINDRFMNIFSEIGKLKDLSVEDEKVQGKIKELQQFISDNYYTCTNEILYSLGQIYVNDERFKKNIDNAGGEGTAKFVYEAMPIGPGHFDTKKKNTKFDIYNE